MASIILKPGREDSLLRHHPWIFSGAIKDVFGAPLSGETVIVISSSGEFLAKAAYSPRSKISARVWTWNENEQVDAEFIHRRMVSSIKLREEIAKLLPKTNAIRLVYSESDGLPGVVVDRYDNVLVIQLTTTGAEFWRSVILEACKQILGIRCIYERSDSDVRMLEGLDSRNGSVWGEEPTAPLIIEESGITFQVDIYSGQKTGFFLDQRSNRLLVRRMSLGRDVLDCFCYTGGFTLSALAGGASSVLAIDTSSEALATLKKNIDQTKLSGLHLGLMEGDVFQELRKFRDQARKFDMIILDPPKFAHTILMAERASRGYKDINLLALKLLRPGGLLVTFSCSGGINQDLFQKIVSGAALDAGIEARIHGRLYQDMDHPVALNFPESAYLKGLLISVPG
jgi:23S rRNA (cytosine1962-C5)-methyltransferase